MRFTSSTFAVLLLLAAGPGRAAVFVVNTTSDASDAAPGDGVCADATGACTLRAALREANASEGADEVLLPEGSFLLPGVSYYPWSGENPVWRSDLTLTGAGPGRTMLRGSLAVGLCIFGCSGPSVRIRGLTLEGPADGAGIESYGDIELDGVVVTGSECGVCQRGASLRVHRSSVHGNEWGIAVSGGSAPRYCERAEFELVNTTVSGARAIDLSCTNATVWSSTLVSREGAAISAYGELIEGVDLVLRNSVAIAESTAPACAYWGDVTVVSLGGNLDSDGSCNLTDPTDLPNTDPMLGPLRDNGGPTPTHALLPGSPGIDAIPIADCTYDDDSDPATPEVPLATDQRGVARPQWIGCDIGAFEAFVNAGCGLGAELALVLPLLAISRRRLR